MSRVELPDEGIIICQAENNHVTIRDHGHMIFHGSVTKDLTDDELISLWRSVQNFMKG